MKPLAPRTQEEIQGIDKAALEAVEQAEEKFKIAFIKAGEARKDALDLAAKAGMKAREDLAPQEAAAKVEADKKKDEGRSTAVALRKLPLRENALVKLVAKEALTAIYNMLMAADLSKDAPERLVTLWQDLYRTIDGAGLGPAELKAVLSKVTGAAAVKLCLKKDSDDIEAWPQRLSEEYLAMDQAATLSSRIYAARREPTEAALSFLVRMEPIARAVVFMQVLPEDKVLAALWRTDTLGLAYAVDNSTYFEPIKADVRTGRISDIEKLLAAVNAYAIMEKIPKVAAPATVPRTGDINKCSHCHKKGHTEKKCWKKHPELTPAWALNSGGSSGSSRSGGAGSGAARSNGNEATASEYVAAPVGRNVFVINAAINGMAIQLGLDSMAALNLIRHNALPDGTPVAAGGPTLHGVGRAAARGTVKLAVTVGDLTFAEVEFAVVDDLPVAGLLGKPTLTGMGTRMDLAQNTAEVCAGQRSCTVEAIAIPATALGSDRPQAQSYWAWLNKRMADAPKRLQTVFQDVVERANNTQLELFMAGFADWALRQRQESGQDDASQHPAPYREELKRPASVTTGLVVCPTMVSGNEILSRLGEGDLLAVVADDNRDFLPPVTTFQEEDAQVEAALLRIVEEAELSPSGKEELKRILQRQRAAFGMQLRKVNFDQEPVHTFKTGELQEHQPRRIIRDPRVRDAQTLWETAMEERGMVGDLTSKEPEKARPINIHHVIRDNKIRFTADARTLNAVTIPDSFPVPSPLEALERFRRNKLFSTTDEADSFFQYPYDDESRVPFYSARGGIKEFRVMIQGGKNSPAALHRKKTGQYQDFSPEAVAFMFDDTLLGTPKGEMEHLKLVEQFLANCVEHGTILKPTKTKLCRSEVIHQGFVIGHGYYYKDPEAVRPLAEMRAPTTASELKSQMSMLGRYRHFVPEYAQLAAPLEAIMHERWRDDTFTPKHNEALIEIRRQIAQETMLTMPDWNRPFHWRIDAQPTFGWAGVVGQEDDDGNFYPIRFMSKKASDADTKRWPTEMEAMAWFYCLCEKGRVYSQYSKNIIHGDPKSLRWLADSIESGRSNRQMQRVALALQALDITFKYHPREEMVDVDALSRFALDRRGSRESLKKFLATDKEAIENTLIVAATVATQTQNMRSRGGGMDAIAIPAGVGPDSPPGVPINIAAEQAVDPACQFIMMIKRNEFRDEAEQDAFLKTMPAKTAKALKHHMDVAKSREFGEFEIRSGKLFLVDVNRLKNPRLRLVLPARLRARVLTANHDAASAGHGGFDKTYTTLSRLYFWFGMYADAKEWIKSCPACAKGKRRTIAGHGTARHQGLMPMKFKPYERVVMDLIGPLPESRDGMKHILVIVDAYSSETRLEPIKSRNSEDIANILLKRVVLSDGCPLSWQSDRAPELLKGAVEKLAQIAGIEPKACSAYQAHVEGRVERRNWLVATMLREMCKDDVQGWPAHLMYIEFAINTTPYSVTGQTPYFHKTGYDVISPGNAWREIGEGSGEPVETWSKRVTTATQFAELAHASAAELRKERYDKGKQPHGIEENDEVYMWIAREHKLQQSAMGPMVVKRFLDPVTKRSAVVHPPGQPEETVVVHVDRLIKVHERPADLVRISPDLSDWIEKQGEKAKVPQQEMDGAPQVTVKQRPEKDKQEEVWEIDRIVARVEDKNESRRYRVHYTGYDDPKDDRWYDEDQLRAMGRETANMLDTFDAEEDKRKLQGNIAPREDGAGTRKSTRVRSRVTFKGG